MMKRCEIGSKSDQPCGAPQAAYFQESAHAAHPGRELRVCIDHAHDALGDGAEVYNDAGEQLVIDAESGEYVWSDL